MSPSHLFHLIERFEAARNRGRIAVRRRASRFLNFFTPRRTRRLAAGLSAAFMLVVVTTAYADAQAANPAAAVADAIGQGIFVVLNSILFVIIQTVAQLASLVVSLLVAISQFNKFSTVRVVDIGWTIVKDVSNMLFIIALLVIAAGTVLRLENYRYNRLLSNLIIMAFLTNFSKFIAAFFIQGAQVLMLTFVNAYKEALFGNFVSAFGLDQVFKFSPDASTLTGAATFGNMLAGLILVVIALIITAAICVVFFVRIVALWILVILSPLAFASQILPNTKSFASRWWSEFGKYTIQGPILAFFLWLALAIISVGNGAASIDPSLGEITNQANNARGGANFFQLQIFTLDNLMTFVISAAFLTFGLNYATSSSGVAGKWAGKVASNGFAGAKAIGGTISGINAIRDRAVAPVQGWIKNRASARQSAIQERTQTLEAAGDRLRAAVPNIGVENIPGLRRVPGLNKIGTRAGGERSAAAAAVYERQRTQRFIQARGLGDMTTNDLQDRAQKSSDQRERLAALQTLQSRGAVDLSKKEQRDSFNEIISNQRIPAADKKKLREEMMSNYAKGLNGDELHRQLEKAGSKEDRIVFARRLQEVNALKVGNDKDEGIVRQLRADLLDTPDKLRAFDESMMKTNQNMAKKIIFNDLADVGDRRNLLLAVQQKQISASVLNKDTQQKFDRAGQKGEIADFLIANSPDEAALRGFYNQMDPEAAREIFKHVDMKGETSNERRAMVAEVTGEMGKAFTDATGTYMEAQAKEYADSLGGDALSKNISIDALQDEKVLATLYNSSNMKFPHWEAIRNRSKETREALSKGLSEYAGKLADKDGNIDLDPSNSENNFVVSSLALASKGEDLRMNLKTKDGKRAYESLVRGGKAADLAKLNKSKAFADPDDRLYMTQAYGMHADPGKIGDMLQFENYDFAEESLKAGEKEMLKRIDDGDMKAFSRLSQMSRHPVLSGIVGAPERPSKIAAPGGAALGLVTADNLRRSGGEPAKEEKSDTVKNSRSDNNKRNRTGFKREQDKDNDMGPDDGGAPAPTPPREPRGPSGAPQNVLIANLNPEQRQARQDVINIRQANQGKIPDLQFSELAQKILSAEDLSHYRELSRVPSQILTDADRQLLKEFQTQLGIKGTDAQTPDEYLDKAQLAARQQLVETRQQNSGRIPEDQLRQLGQTILGDKDFEKFQKLNQRPSQVLSDADRELLKDLSIRLGYLEPGT